MTEDNLSQAERHKSYDLIQKLAFFIIGLEVVFCGYCLLNAKHFSQVKYLLCYLFLVSGFAVCSGLLWRFCHNLVYSRKVHDELLPRYKLWDSLRGITHAFFVFSSALFFISTWIGGCIMLFQISEK